MGDGDKAHLRLGRQRTHWKSHRQGSVGTWLHGPRFDSDLNDPMKTEHVLAHASDLGCENRLELVEEMCSMLTVGPAKWKVRWPVSYRYHLFARGTATEILDTANKGTSHLLHAAAEAGSTRGLPQAQQRLGRHQRWSEG